MIISAYIVILATLVDPNNTTGVTFSGPNINVTTHFLYLQVIFSNGLMKQVSFSNVIVYLATWCTVLQLHIYLLHMYIGVELVPVAIINHKSVQNVLP